MWGGEINVSIKDYLCQKKLNKLNTNIIDQSHSILVYPVLKEEEKSCKIH